MLLVAFAIVMLASNEAELGTLARQVQQAMDPAFDYNGAQLHLEPYIGIVAKTVFVDYADDCAAADRLVAAHFSDRARFASPRCMAPMPVLGVPGWDERNSREEFYDDRDHFRGKIAT